MTGTTMHCIVDGTVENWFSCDRLGLLQKEGNTVSTEMNKALVRRWVEEVLNTPGNLAAVDVLFAPDYVDYTNPPDWPPGRQGHKQIVALYHAAFPDFHYTIEHEVSEGDMVVVRGTLSPHAHRRRVFWHRLHGYARHDDRNASLTRRRLEDHGTLVQ